jgi:hypothetical protein
MRDKHELLAVLQAPPDLAASGHVMLMALQQDWDKHA